MRADKKALIHMDVPESVLASGTAGVHDYGPEASTQWEERVGYYSIPDKKLASAMKERNHQNQVISTMNEHNLSEWDDAEKIVKRTYDETAETIRADNTAARIIAERAAEVTIGAETPVIFNSKSTVFELGNGPEMQYAFKGGAYGRLAGYKSGLVRYQEDRQGGGPGGGGRSCWWRCQLL
ncbi:uncharacterized protein TRIVIDRAFT_216170 [Trichoderma virens Gv29-8]|uniref:Uncharacterized protein n=1 Tax=Hypocrea virens (strain Gv29-8 / FGSC 10586) TaxID=413071 RepID=G9MUG9_HYPVG|nr:uncharacterized protein TRIVIDRAFT_216170 [Trichoderma virens Gv29-8]EHK21913.1 hypothetical protein TRIVIDRAFT_216170 [Trichoderma virens Gv29-8]